MSHTAVARTHAASLLVPGVLLAGLLGFIALEADLFRLLVATDPGLVPQTVTIAPWAFTYRASGVFQRAGAAVDGPLISVDVAPVLEIMKFQVSASDYRRCVAEGACEEAEPRRRGKGDVPVTGVSFDDASRYASWLSARTGEIWRLPTVAEWQFAAGSKAGDEALGIESDDTNPSARWLASYASRLRSAPAHLQCRSRSAAAGSMNLVWSTCRAQSGNDGDLRQPLEPRRRGRGPVTSRLLRRSLS